MFKVTYQVTTNGPMHTSTSDDLFLELELLDLLSCVITSVDFEGRIS